jgi:NitT/TauT family transport system substrate-binding protein
MKTLRLETTAPFQGLAELVAYDEGLFEKEGIQIEWMDREKGVDKSPQLHITDHKDASRYTSHGRMMESGQADLYNACEWGNYSRVETSNVGSRQVGRRSMVNFAGLVVRADSPVQVPQQFANVQIGVPMYSGTHYLCLQMLEGFVPRELIKIGRVPNGSNYRFKMLMDRTIEATTLTEPYISLAEKMGCRVVISAFHHGTDVASDRVDGETYAAFNRASAKPSGVSMRTSAPICTTSSTTIAIAIRRSASSPSTICARADSIWSIRRRSRPMNSNAPTSG